MEVEPDDTNSLGYRKQRVTVACPKHGNTQYHTRHAGRHICCEPESKWYLFGMTRRCGHAVGATLKRQQQD